LIPPESVLMENLGFILEVCANDMEAQTSNVDKIKTKQDFMLAPEEMCAF
jgi:hypothetical protein